MHVVGESIRLEAPNSSVYQDHGFCCDLALLDLNSSVVTHVTILESFNNSAVQFAFNGQVDLFKIPQMLLDCRSRSQSA